MKPKDKERIISFLEDKVKDGEISNIEAENIKSNIPKWTDNNKDYKYVSYTTPNGNKCKGYICKKRSSYRAYGSLYIYSVNEHPVSHYYQGMPRLRYVDSEYFDSSVDEYHVYEKFDGTNILIYPLRDHNNNIIEAIPKTRATPFSHGKWMDILNEIPLFEYYKQICLETGDSIICELYGKNNIHDIIYEEQNTLAYLFTIKSDQHTFKRELYYGTINNINPLAILKRCDDKDGYLCNSNVYEYGNIYPFLSETNKITYPTVHEFSKILENSLEDYNKHQKTIKFEGAVVYKIKNGEIISLRKIKPKSVKESHFERSRQTIPSNIIRNCIRKAKQVTVDTKKEFIKEINNELLEDFSEDFVFSKKNQKKIYKVLAESTPDDDILGLAKKIYEENSSMDKKELMQIFAKQYPELKSKSRKFYQALEGIERGF